MPRVEMTCPRFRVEMIPQSEKIDLSRARGGPNAEARFAGILDEILRCPSCCCQAIRPAALDIRAARLAIA